MSGRHEAPPLGSLARDATAPPYHGRHRAPEHTWADTIAEIERVSNEWPDGIHTCAELQVLEPGRRACSCGRCERAERVADERWSDPEDTHQGGPDDV